MKVIVGLGNPGKEYSNTRHNTGWMFVKHMENKFECDIERFGFNANIKEITINYTKVLFVRPTTYMNLSGDTVRRMKEWFKLSNEDFLIIYDDIDIEFGKIRFRKSGSGGTHNGMRHIVESIGGTDIPRLRIGIGKPKNLNKQLVSYVLEKFSEKELKDLKEEVFTQCEDILIDFLDKS